MNNNTHEKNNMREKKHIKLKKNNNADYKTKNKKKLLSRHTRAGEVEKEDEFVGEEEAVQCREAEENK